jgi:hypothetical protein
MMVFFDERERSWETHYRGEAGALRRKALSWFAACVLVLTAERRAAARKVPIISTRASALLGTPDDSPAYSPLVRRLRRRRGRTSGGYGASFAAGARDAPPRAPPSPWPSGGGRA